MLPILLLLIFPFIHALCFPSHFIYVFHSICHHVFTEKEIQFQKEDENSGHLLKGKVQKAYTPQI
jgi:hypothetical protein